MTRAREHAWRFLKIIGRSFALSALAFGAAIHPGLMRPPPRVDGLRTRAGESR
jgi:hypothetical protein